MDLVTNNFTTMKTGLVTFNFLTVTSYLVQNISFDLNLDYLFFIFTDLGASTEIVNSYVTMRNLHPWRKSSFW